MIDRYDAAFCNCSVDRSAFEHTARCKLYPDGSRDLLVCDRPIFRAKGWERRGWKVRPKSVRGDYERNHAQESSDRGMRRARAQVRDIALCTPFAFFVTLTLDGAKVDRYDMGEITRRLNHWLDNQVRRRGLCYVLVPERHKDGAIHFHGFFNDALAVVDSGHVDREGHTVYNLPGWSLGFTTAIRLYGDYARAVGYVCKYIGKQGEKPGGRWYYSGGKLGRPRVVYADVSIRDVEALPGAYSFTVAAAGLGFCMVRERGEVRERAGQTGRHDAAVGQGRGEAGLDGGPGEGRLGEAGLAGPGGVRAQARRGRQGQAGGPGRAPGRPGGGGQGPGRPRRPGGRTGGFSGGDGSQARR